MMAPGRRRGQNQTGAVIARPGVTCRQNGSHMAQPESRLSVLPSLSLFLPAYNDAPSLPSLIGRAYSTLARVLFRIGIRDIDCDFRLIRRHLLKDLHLTSTSGTICVELVRKLELSGCGATEVGVRHLPRLHGRSQFSRVRSLLSTFAQLLRLYTQWVIQPALRDPHRWPVLVRYRAPAGRLWKEAA
jgi:hypothetical protein